MNTALLPSNVPLAIVGIGCLFPKADAPGYFWGNIKHGTDCITDVPATHWNPQDYFDIDPKKPDMTYARRGGFLNIQDFNPLEFGIAPRDIEATDTTQLLSLVAAKQALTDAQVDLNKTDRSKVSVILGVTGTLELVIPLGARLGHPKWREALRESGVADDVAQDVLDRMADSYVPWQENSFPGLLGNVVAGRIANRLDLHGTNCVVDAACASSLSAVHLASLELATGKADVVVTGGADTFNDIFMFMCFSKTPALSPSGDSKPFDANGDGTILGEGIGMVVLKRLADAERDGDRVYAVIRGIGTSSDGKGNAIYAPSSEGQKRCLNDAYTRAGVPIDTIELLEAHGTGTKVGDATEAKALAEVFSENATPASCAIGSVKSQIGHTKAAAGSASLIKVALALFNKVLPPTIKVTMPVDPLAQPNSPFYVNTQMRPWLPRVEHPRRAGLSAFGFGGSNFHAVLEEHTPNKTAPDWDGRVQILALSATTIADVQNKLEAVQNELQGANASKTWDHFARAAEASRQSFSVQHEVRLVLVAHRDNTKLEALVGSAREMLAKNPSAKSWHTPDGIFFGSGAAEGKLGILFPGQGSQAVGMLREAACLFPEMLETLTEANRAFESDSPQALRLTDWIYPPHRFTPDGLPKQEEELRATSIAQPAIGAVSFGMWKVLSQRFGLQADAFAGHSFGELTALAAAGRITPADFLQLGQLRGLLMERAKPSEPSGMIAVLAPLPTIEEILKESKLNLVIANKNGPKQTVLSGALPEIEVAFATFQSEQIRCTKLPVAAAFHSAFVSAAAEPFRQALNEMEFLPARLPVYSNTTGAEYPEDVEQTRDLLGNQLAQPVEFVKQIQAMLASGVRTFLEVGPGTVLTRLTDAILAEAGTPNTAAFAIDASSGKKAATLDMSYALARLAALGHAVALDAWERESACKPTALPAKPIMTVPVCGANSVLPRPKRPARAITTPKNATTSPQKVSASAAGTRTMNDSHSEQLNLALQLTQQTLAALQRIQDETAQLHKQFLERQEQAQVTLHTLIAHQQLLLMPGSAPLAPIVMPQVFVPAPQVFAPAAPMPMTSAVAQLLSPPPMPTPEQATQRIQAPLPRFIPPPVHKSTLDTNISDVLLGVVSEKTGYPTEMLNLEMTLDGDLGVDSIKRVEILSALQDKLPHAPIVKPEHLGTLHSLRDVAQFLTGPTGSTPVPATPARSAFPTVPQSLRGVQEPALTIAGPVTIESMYKTNSAQTAGSDVAEVLLNVVSEKTGYPTDMLTLEMTLDGDLGVDSIKRVEILSALQDKLPHAPVVKPEHLGTLHSLRDVALFLSGSSNTGKPAAVNVRTTPQPMNITEPLPPSTRVVTSQPTSEFAPKTEQVSAIMMPELSDSLKMPFIALKPQSDVSATGTANRSTTGLLNTEKVDRSILQPVDLDVTSLRSRVPLNEGGEIWIVASVDTLCTNLCEQLRAQRFIPRVFDWSVGEPADQTGNPIGLILLTPGKIPTDIDLNLAAFRWLQAVGPRLRQAARSSNALVITVARLDGHFGLTEMQPSSDPTSGGLAGLVKTARFEWPELVYKAIDLSPDFIQADAMAASVALADELFAAGPLEVGISATHRITPELVRTVRKSTASNPTFGPKDVILVTGGARGVTAEVAATLAESYRSAIAIVGRTPLPTGGEPAWLSAADDETSMKKAISENLGVSATPKAVAEAYTKYAGQREVRQTIQRIEQAGARVGYFAADVTNQRTLGDVLQQIQVKLGQITAIIHGAGVLADKRIEDQTAEQFQSVYNTKVRGLRNILELLGSQELKAMVLFSSTTARFGRTGQIAYAVANEVLNKTAQTEARRRPSARVVAINWGPWEGGMVTPGLRKVFENEGVGLIPLIDGALFALNELNAGGRSAEVVALGRPRAIAKPGSGIIPGGAINRPLNTPSQPAQPAAPLTNPPSTETALVFERTVDLDTHPVLRSHVIDGRAVLPMSLHMEWLAHAALHGNPGLVFHGFNDMRVTNGIMVEEGVPTVIRAMAGRATKNEKMFQVTVELRGKRRDGRDVVHSRADVILTAALPKAPPAHSAPEVQPYPHPLDEIYHYFLFHGPELHGIERVQGVSEVAFVGSVYPAPTPGEWLREPLRNSWVADPLVLDASFQMMILWSYAQHGAGSLPCFAGRYRQYRRTFPANPVRVNIRITRDNGSFARADIDYIDSTDGSIIGTMQDYECVIDPQLNQAFRRNQLAPRHKQQS